jgi:hypothetical protein
MIFGPLMRSPARIRLSRSWRSDDGIVGDDSGLIAIGLARTATP